jgi:hypothetical protein
MKYSDPPNQRSALHPLPFICTGRLFVFLSLPRPPFNIIILDIAWRQKVQLCVRSRGAIYHKMTNHIFKKSFHKLCTKISWAEKNKNGDD